ncbi:MAG TPA: peptide ABC transporter substrate-binding protein [Candidatus Sulfotelmatobacter sp.]|nr:peptide ABC transporter substrate-binding protein [Candidatus Sulfotelmatobacter sp.]
MPTFSLRRFAISLVCALLMLAGQTPARADGHDTLTIGIIQFPSNFNPLIEGMVAKNYILGMALRPFTVHDKDWQLICMLCTKLPTLENGLAAAETLPGGQKGVAITYTIQPNAKWGDGEPVTTKDVLFTWEVGKHPQTGVSNGDMFRRIRAIDVKDDKTFTLHVTKLTFDYNAINDFVLLPEHLEKKAFAEPADYRTRTLYDTDTGNPGLYNGPYRIAQVARGQYVVLEPNPYWWGAQPAFKRIVVKAVEATPALEANLLSGGIDMIAGEIGFTLDAALAFETRHRPEWTVTYKPGLSFEHISLNLDNPILADRRVRRALLMGLDRPMMMHQIFQDKQAIANGPVNPLDWVYDPTVPTVPYDPEGAAALLEQAGWSKSADGVRRNAKGEKLAIELMTTAGLRNREVTELVAQQSWKRLGVESTIRNQPARTFFGESVLRHNFPSTAMFAWMSAPESVPRTTLRSDMVPTALNNYAGQNVGAYHNPKMDALIDAIETELDRDKRRELWKQLQALYAEDLPDLPLTFRSDPYVLPLWLKGVEPTGHQYPTTLWVENWKAQ